MLEALDSLESDPIDLLGLAGLFEIPPGRNQTPIFHSFEQTVNSGGIGFVPSEHGRVGDFVDQAISMEFPVGERGEDGRLQEFVEVVSSAGTSSKVNH
jgi:hypothetical protein